MLRTRAEVLHEGPGRPRLGRCRTLSPGPGAPSPSLASCLLLPGHQQSPLTAVPAPPRRPALPCLLPGEASRVALLGRLLCRSGPSGGQDHWIMSWRMSSPEEGSGAPRIGRRAAKMRRQSVLHSWLSM